MARLRHPNIVLLLGAVRSPPAIVEEFCARGSLFSVLQRHTKPGVPPLEWRVRLQMALGAAAGMCYLHNCAPPIIHRDLKSPNLMVDRYFRVKVGDFNLSRVAVASVAPKPAPEARAPNFQSAGCTRRGGWRRRCLQSAAYTRASDVYSFAVVLWELRSLQVPWAQVGQWQVMHAVVEEGQRPDLDEVPTPTFSSLSQYDALIRDGWAQESSERPAFEEIITRLQGIIDAHAASSSTSSGGRTRSGSSRGDSRAAPPAAPPKSPPRSPKRHSRPGSPVKTHSPPKLGAKRTPVEDGAVRDHGAIAVALAEAPAEVGVEAHDEAEQTLNRILTRKRSTKLDAAAVPKSVAAATDAAVGELRASREWASPMKRKPPARAPPTAAAAAASAAAAAARARRRRRRGGGDAQQAKTERRTISGAVSELPAGEPSVHRRGCGSRQGDAGGPGSRADAQALEVAVRGRAPIRTRRASESPERFARASPSANPGAPRAHSVDDEPDDSRHRRAKDARAARPRAENAPAHPNDVVSPDEHTETRGERMARETRGTAIRLESGTMTVEFIGVDSINERWVDARAHEIVSLERSRMSRNPGYVFGSLNGMFG